VGSELGLSRQRIKQIEEAALEELRYQLGMVMGG
jgi:DNA-directed RNA polymerase sigma subunit (sigma70/sigma32)